MCPRMLARAVKGERLLEVFMAGDEKRQKAHTLLKKVLN